MRDWIALKRIAQLRYGDALPAELRREGDVPVCGSGGISGYHDARNTDIPAIVIGRKGSYGSVRWAERGAFVIDTAYVIDRRSSTVDLRWLFYVLQAVDLKGPSMDVGVPGLSREVAHSALVPAPPPLEEQRRIADFLDGEVSKIDAIARGRDRQLMLILERVRSKIDQLFRAEPSAFHTRLKYLLRQRPRYGVLVPQFVSGAAEGVPLVRVNDLQDGKVRDTALARISSAQAATYARTVIQANDILLGVVGSLGRAAVAQEWLVGANVARAVCVLRVRQGVDVDLLQSWLNTDSFERQAHLVTGSDSAQPTLGMEDLGNFSLSWPRLEEGQRRLSGEIESVQEMGRRALSALARQRSLLTQRRQAFITAAVTGQLDVTTARGSVV